MPIWALILQIVPPILSELVPLIEAAINDNLTPPQKAQLAMYSAVLHGIHSGLSYHEASSNAKS
jgi:hypothetical protein